MALNIFSNTDVSGSGEFEDLTVNDELSADNLFAEDAQIDQADVVFSNYSENTVVIQSTNQIVDIDFALGNTFILHLTEPVNQFNLYNIPDNTGSFTLVVHQDTESPSKSIEWNFSNITYAYSFSAFAAGVTSQQLLNGLNMLYSGTFPPFNQSTYSSPFTGDADIHILWQMLGYPQAWNRLINDIAYVWPPTGWTLDYQTVGPAVLRWAPGPPTVTESLSATDIYSFVSFKGGAAWYGFVGGQNFV